MPPRAAASDRAATGDLRHPVQRRGEAVKKHVELADVLIDVTHRHPMKQDCQPNAAREPGHCCRQAACDKKRRYHAAGGRKVFTACVEAWGWPSEEAETAATSTRTQRVIRPRMAQHDAIQRRDGASGDATNNGRLDGEELT